MKNFSNFALSRVGLVSLLSLCVIIFSISFISISDETVRYKTFDSSVAITNASSAQVQKTNSNIINCEANFTFDEGKVMDVSNFQFQVPFNQFDIANPNIESAIHTVFKLNQVTQVSFVQEKVMVLPTMKMIHVIGLLTMANVEHSLAFQFTYVINKDKSISINGEQTIDLAEFGLKIPDALKNVVDNSIKIKLNLKMIDEELIVPRSKFAINYE
ncbi:YceI family protein [Pedobacter sp. Du54]|uniref:YceI family protein n=1 Tax=Pedobacter anseongensis TaxID=3133439 RepID=UPI0030B71431